MPDCQSSVGAGDHRGNLGRAVQHASDVILLVAKVSDLLQTAGGTTF